MQRDQLLAGRYRLTDRLGTGGMSTVWRAHDEVLERDVAVKVLTATDPAARWRIRAEAKAAARMSHPNLTNVYDFGESPLAGDRVPFVVMELLTGTTLARRLTTGPLPPRDALRVCADVAAGLAAAHAQHLVHRDVKPENVMLTPTGAKVLDFGIAAGVGQPEIDVEGRLLGTPAYTAPERLAAGEVLSAADVYALGLLVHHVLVGRLPWRRRTRTGFLRAHAYDEPGPLPDVDGVPSEVGRLYRRCLAKNPADRPTAAEAARILTGALLRMPGPETGDAPEEAPDRSSDASPPAGPALRPLVTAPEGRPATAARRTRYGTRLLVAVAAAMLGAVALAGTLGSPAFRRPGTIEEPETGLGTSGTSSVALPVTGDAPGPSSRPGAPAASSAVRSIPVPTSTAVPGTGSTPTGGATGAPSTGGPSPTEVVARGGTVSVRCDGRTALIVDVAPAAGHQLGQYEPGPAREVRVELVSAGSRSVVTARCANGRPVARVQEDPPVTEPGRPVTGGRPAGAAPRS
ncbi:protein kinase domain-containing protein [Micromonospora thermarum]|uniref:protein kinase domain-containing protein n=1 Tax=Micromonospora thermarum TaxID=2720024 RepID=UPI002814FC2C|nr:protein kinase [Micromonospora thermarum]